jgi:Tfp pilus assembly protein PilX
MTTHIKIYRHSGRARQQGVALPVMLIMLLVMLVGSIYLLKSTNSTTLTTSNLAYDSALGRAADLGLHSGFEWLSATAAANKARLDADDAGNGYLATLDTSQTPSDDGFWHGSKTIKDDADNEIVYVVHRLCSMPGPYDEGNSCVQTAANSAALGNAVALGSSLSVNAPAFAETPQVHYVITSRISGPRGGSVVNQLVVLIGA